METNQKVTAEHLKRNAYLYVRQSSLHQVLENTESTQRQYALRQRAIALGWSGLQVVVIDQDLGLSGASAADREGFQYLVAEVGMGRAGLVLGLEVSRLARNSVDWQRLLEICALSGTLILDEDGLYDPSLYNDRLLLGLKGTISEAELHVLRARLRGGILSKAKRGDLRSPLPLGFRYDEAGQVAFDLDEQVQQSVRLFFQTYRRTGAATATVKEFRQRGLKFPRRLRGGPRKGELLWVDLTHSRALELLHNPRYAGAFFFGRTRSRKLPDGKVAVRTLPLEQWHSLVVDSHEGYISWEHYQDNRRQLRAMAQAYSTKRDRTPPREGPALLQGIAICGVCGRRMTVRYRRRGDRLLPEYVCQSEGIKHAQDICQSIPGAAIDQAIGDLLIQAVSPMALEVSLAVQQELRARLEEADRLRHKQVERAEYEAELAKRRYMQVDPDNRLVAGTLEAEWNAKLRELDAAQEEYNRKRQEDRLCLDEEQLARILALTSDFPRLWRDPDIPHRERKRMVRLLLDDVTLLKGQQVTAHVRFKGGMAQTLTLPMPLSAWQIRQTSREVVAEMNRLIDDHLDDEIAEILNQQGLRSGQGKPFHCAMVGEIRRAYGLKNRYDRLREAGLLTRKEMADLLGISKGTLRNWRQQGRVRAHACTRRNEYLYEHPGDKLPIKWQQQKLQRKQFNRPIRANHAEEVQYEA